MSASITEVMPNRIAGKNTPIVIGDSLGNDWQIVPDGTNGQLNVKKNGVTAAIGGLVPVVTKTAAYTCTLADSGTFFNTKGAAGTVVFTLPAVATSGGVHYRFIAAANQILTVTAPAGTLVTYNNAAATSVSTGTVNIGHGFELVCDGSFWYAHALEYVTANTTVA